MEGNDKMVKAAILRSAGTNCNYETEQAFRMSGAEAEQVHINELISNAKRLSDYDIVALPGGFSYGDYIAAGTIFANQLMTKLQKEVQDYIAEGKLLIGICNGFQILVRAGLLPGDGMRATLTNNSSGKFECRWTKMVRSNNSKLTEGLNQVNVPVAHGEGRFVADAETLQKLEQNNQIIFRYSGPAYPENPNGSMNDIAGISNRHGNVIGLMPHPERHLTCLNHPKCTRIECSEGEGIKFFKNIVTQAKKKEMKNERLSAVPRQN